MPSREFCKIFKNTFFEEHLWTTASKNFLCNCLNVNVSQQSYIYREWMDLSYSDQKHLSRAVL